MEDALVQNEVLKSANSTHLKFSNNITAIYKEHVIEITYFYMIYMYIKRYAKNIRLIKELCYHSEIKYYNSDSTLENRTYVNGYEKIDTDWIYDPIDDK